MYLCEADRDWFQRLGDIMEEDQVIWWTGRKEIGPGVTLVQCGGYVSHPTPKLTIAISQDHQSSTGTVYQNHLLPSPTFPRNPPQCLESYLQPIQSWSNPLRLNLHSSGQHRI